MNGFTGAWASSAGGAWDFRLGPAACAVWATTVLGLWMGWPVAAGIGVAGLAVLLVVWFTARAHPWIYAVAAVLLVMVVSAAGIALRMHQVTAHPLHEIAHHGKTVTVRARLVETPRPLHGASYGVRKAEDRALARADLVAVQDRGRWTQAGGEIVLLVPTAGWRYLIAGQQVTGTGRAVPARSGELAVAAVQMARPPHDISAAPLWQQAAGGLRHGLRHASDAVLSPDIAALLPALVVGDTSEIPAELDRDLKASGLTHLMAVSGANVAIICGSVLIVLRAVGAGPRGSAAGAGVALLGFVTLTGPEASVLRAAVMGSVALLALVLGRERSALPALCGSVIVLLLISPELATDVGFALSVVATAGLVLLAPGWAHALHAKGIPKVVAEALAAAAAAHVVTAPIIAAIAGEVSVVAIFANLLAEPVIAPATVFGVLATVTTALSGWVADGFVWLSAPEIRWLAAVARHSARVPGATFPWPAGAIGGVILAVAVLVSLIMLRHKRIRYAAGVLLLAVGLFIVPVKIFAPRWPAQGWSVVACDVGQGDGLVLATGQPHTAVVIDTGPDPLRYSDCLRRLDIRRIPLILLTHLHADHVSGLAAVLADHAVGAIAIGGLHEPKWAMADVIRDTHARGVRLMSLSAGQRMAWPGLVLDVVGPVGSLARASSAQDANDASLVVRAATPAGRVLLTGDIELEGQSQLVSSGVDLRADILKTPHHGSRYTTPRFLSAVRPRLALISVGSGNRYGHPSPLVVSAMQGMGTKVLRTDQEGDIAVIPGQRGPATLSRGDPVRARSP